jgi:branched-chain amino acid transport system permease protein
MAAFLQQVVAGLASGGIYASLALAIALIYRSTGVINFAQGEMATLTTYVVWSLNNHGLGFWGAFAITLVLAFVGGVALERVVIRPFESSPVLTIVMVTIGLFFVLNGLTSVIWGGGQRRLPTNRPFPTATFDVGGVQISRLDVGLIALMLAAVAALAALFRYTKLGLGLRAAALQPASSRLVGIRVGWMLAVGWGLAAALGAVSGVMAAASYGSFDPTLMQTILLYAFAAAVLGGIDSPLGAVVGGLALGVLLNLLGTYVGWIGSTLRLPTALLVILLVLLVRPTGLFGRATVRRV